MLGILGLGAIFVQMNEVIITYRMPHYTIIANKTKKVINIFS